MSTPRNRVGPTRRRLLQSAAIAAAGWTVIPRHVLGGQGHTPPSEQTTRAVIGCGGMGSGHIESINTESRLLAICDVDEARLEKAKKLKNVTADTKVYKDWREVLERPEIDIVHIPTPPHWHALMSIAAAQAGKDIWCEKPMTRTIAEGEKVIEAVRRHGRIFRLNTWFRFDSNFYAFGSTVKPVKKLVNSGMLGWPLKVTVGVATGFDWKVEQWTGRTSLVPQTVPKTFDYDMWLGPAPWRPYHPHRTHSTFRGYWDYDGGGLGDMGQHYIDPVQYLLDKDDDSPVEIEAETPPQHDDAVLPWRRVEMRYADGCRIILDGDNRDKDAAFIEGPRGKLYKGMRTDPPDLLKKLEAFPEPEPQLTNFLTAVKTRRKFALNEQNGHRSCTLVNLAKIAVQLGRPLKFDPAKLRFVNEEEANRLIDQPMRGPWHL